MKPFHLLLVVASVNHAVFTGAKMSVLLYAVHLGASPLVGGTLIALFSAPVILLSVSMGRWADRKGARLPMLFASLLMTAGAANACLAQSVGALFVTSVLVGCSYNLFVVCSMQQAGLLGDPAERVGNYSLLMQGYAMANFTAPLIVGFSIDHFGHATAFAILALLPMIPFAVLALNRLALVAGTHEQGAAGGAREAPEKASGSIFGLLRAPLLRRIFVGALLSFSAMNLYVFLTPLHGTQIGLSASQIGMVLSSFAIATVVVRGLAPRAARHFSPWQMLIASLAVTGASLMFAGLFAVPWMLMAIGFVCGLALGLGGPVALALMQENSPPGRLGEVLGLRMSMVNVLQTTVPMAAGAVSGLFGAAPSFVFLALLMLAGAAYMRDQWRTGAPAEAGGNATKAAKHDNNQS